jgi:hypothetical protein
MSLNIVIMVSPISINITKDPEKKTNQYDEFKEYIIKNNVELQKDVKANLMIIKSLEAIVMEKESEEDKYDTRLRYMKGLFQNLSELRNDYSKITTKTEEKIKIINIYYNKIKKLVKFDLINYIVIIIFIIYFSNMIFSKNFTIIIINTISFMLACYCCKNIINNISSYNELKKNLSTNLSKLDEEIKELKDQITKTEEATLSLDNWIGEI